MRTLQFGIVAVVAMGMATLVGCESLTPMGPSLVDQHMGDAIRANVAQQTENPNAAYENTEATHIDPDTAAAVIERYYENQRQPNMQQQAPSAVFQIESN